MSPSGKTYISEGEHAETWRGKRKVYGDWKRRGRQLQLNAREYAKILKIVSGNNPMVGMTVAVAVAVSQAMAK